jgi:integral membrane sensor domain MASE1
MLRDDLKSIFGPTSPPLWLRALRFAVAYFLCAEVGNFLTPPGHTYVSFWLPVGLYVAVLLLNEQRHWAWFMVAALPANLLFDLLKGTPWQLGLAFYAANTLQAGLGAWLVQTLVAKQPRLRTVKEFFGFLALAGIFATAPGRRSARRG